jgi:hypothetical protein
MQLQDLIPLLKSQKQAPEELAQDYVEAVVKASFDDMTAFRLNLQRAEPSTKKAKDAFQAYTTLVILFAAKNPQYVKKINEYTAHIEGLYKNKG